MKFAMLIGLFGGFVLTLGILMGHGAAVRRSCLHAGWEYTSSAFGGPACQRTYPSGNGSQITEVAPWPLGTPVGAGTRIRIP